MTKQNFSVYVARKIPQAGLAILQGAGFKVEVNPDPERILPKNELIERTKGKDALLSLLTDTIDEEMFTACPDLKIVSNYAVGFNNIDIDAATRHKVLVTNTPGVLTDTVAEHTIALMMAAARRIVEADRFAREGKFKAWGPLSFLGRDLHSMTLGIIGLGRIGGAVARIAANGFNMKILYHKRHRDHAFEKEIGATFCDLEMLLKQSDFISIHVPFGPETEHLIGSRELGIMKKEAVLVNTARGPIVDEKALVDALKNGEIAAAALDVFECEPSLTCDPQRKTQLKELDNIILTPHIASASISTRNKMAETAARAISYFASGKTPENSVNPEVL